MNVSDSPTGIIPEELFNPGKVAEVMQFLQRLYVDSLTKAELFRGWAQDVGVKVSASQVAAVRRTGTDTGGWQL